MCASLVVTLANLWTKSSGQSTDKPNEGKKNKIPGRDGSCIDSNGSITLQAKEVECKSYKHVFHAKCQDVTVRVYRNMKEIAWICSYCAEFVRTAQKNSRTIQIRGRGTKLLRGKEAALVVTDALPYEGEKSSAHPVNTGFMQNVKELLPVYENMQHIACICSYCAENLQQRTQRG